MLFRPFVDSQSYGNLLEDGKSGGAAQPVCCSLFSGDGSARVSSGLGEMYRMIGSLAVRCGNKSSGE